MINYQDVVNILEEVKAKDIKIYDFNKTSPFYDYFIIATVNERQANAAANNLKQAFKDDILNSWATINQETVFNKYYNSNYQNLENFEEHVYKSDVTLSSEKNIILSTLGGL